MDIELQTIFPRLKSRGSIEASGFNSIPTNLRPFPRLKSRGSIEATSRKRSKNMRKHFRG